MEQQTTTWLCLSIPGAAGLGDWLAVPLAQSHWQLSMSNCWVTRSCLSWPASALQGTRQEMAWPDMSQQTR